MLKSMNTPASGWTNMIQMDGIMDECSHHFLAVAQKLTIHSLCFDLLQNIDEEDEKALEKFMSSKQEVRRTLADIIQEKLTEKKTELQSQMTGMVNLKLLHTY